MWKVIKSASNEVTESVNAIAKQSNDTLLLDFKNSMDESGKTTKESTKEFIKHLQKKLK